MSSLKRRSMVRTRNSTILSLFSFEQTVAFIRSPTLVGELVGELVAGSVDASDISKSGSQQSIPLTAGELSPSEMEPLADVVDVSNSALIRGEDGSGFVSLKGVKGDELSISSKGGAGEDGAGENGNSQLPSDGVGVRFNGVGGDEDSFGVPSTSSLIPLSFPFCDILISTSTSPISASSIFICQKIYKTTFTSIYRQQKTYTSMLVHIEQ